MGGGDTGLGMEMGGGKSDVVGVGGGQLELEVDGFLGGNEEAESDSEVRGDQGESPWEEGGWVGQTIAIGAQK